MVPYGRTDDGASAFLSARYLHRHWLPLTNKRTLSLKRTRKTVVFCPRFVIEVKELVFLVTTLWRRYPQWRIRTSTASKERIHRHQKQPFFFYCIPFFLVFAILFFLSFKPPQPWQYLNLIHIHQRTPLSARPRALEALSTPPTLLPPTTLTPQTSGSFLMWRSQRLTRTLRVLYTHMLHVPFFFFAFAARTHQSCSAIFFDWIILQCYQSFSSVLLERSMTNTLLFFLFSAAHSSYSDTSTETKYTLSRLSWQP